MSPQSFGWAVCRPAAWDGGGDPALFTVARTRAEAIGKFMALWGSDVTWKSRYRLGWRARHVVVTPMLFGEPKARAAISANGSAA